MHAKSLQSCLTLWDPINYSPPGSSVHGILQAKILEWVAISSSRGPSQLYIKETSLMSIRGYPRFTCYRKLSLESLNSIPILYLWLANCLFLYLGFKVNDLGLFVPINLIVNLKSQQKCLFFLLFSEQTAANLLYDSHSFQLTIQMAYYFLQPMSYNEAMLKN